MTDITIARTGDKITVTDGERTTSVPYGTENAATRMLTYLTDNPKTAAKMLHEYAKSSLTKKRTPTPDGAIVTSTGDKITVTRSANVIVVSDGQRKVQSIYANAKSASSMATRLTREPDMALKWLNARWLQPTEPTPTV